FERKGRHKEVRPLPLRKHPELRKLLEDLEAAMGDDVADAPDHLGKAPEPLHDDHQLAAQPASVPAVGQELAAAPGWYPDPWTAGPHGASRLRWWDGCTWSTHAHPVT